MLKTVIGYVLLAIGIFIATVLFTYGGPVFPHIVGPVVLAVLGGTVLLIKLPVKHP